MFCFLIANYQCKTSQTGLWAVSGQSLGDGPGVQQVIQSQIRLPEPQNLMGTWIWCGLCSSSSFQVKLCFFFFICNGSNVVDEEAHYEDEQHYIAAALLVIVLVCVCVCVCVCVDPRKADQRRTRPFRRQCLHDSVCKCKHECRFYCLSQCAMTLCVSISTFFCQAEKICSREFSNKKLSKTGLDNLVLHFWNRRCKYFWSRVYHADWLSLKSWFVGSLKQSLFNKGSSWHVLR